jgi:hypothetical protein
LYQISYALARSSGKRRKIRRLAKDTYGGREEIMRYGGKKRYGEKIGEIGGKTHHP